ncbi:hypothetical protein NKR19_g4925 [Coniochaeta hoffmannii]|uniref:Uncharacterized protein n=1 Tax=Coniochaeta hoffmannii TaxID=91930 RepID=A0AA38S049_9PEZI|nr:hypothetical protein NKR19_g4925 [Coniochaeta hoffmannii]
MPKKKASGHVAKAMSTPASQSNPKPAPIPVDYRLKGFEFDGVSYDQDILQVIESPQPFYNQKAGAAERIVSVLVAFMHVAIWFANYRHLEDLFFDAVGEALARPQAACLRLARRLARARLSFKRRHGRDYKVYFGNSRSDHDLLPRKIVDLVHEYMGLCENQQPLPRLRRGETMWDHTKPLSVATRKFIATTPQDLALKPPTIAVQAFIEDNRDRSRSPRRAKNGRSAVGNKNRDKYRSRSLINTEPQHVPRSPSNSGLFVGPPPSPKPSQTYIAGFLVSISDDDNEIKEEQPPRPRSNKENEPPSTKASVSKKKPSSNKARAT